MVVFLSLIPNKGPPIPHQTGEYFAAVTYCRIYNMNFVYNPFIGASNHFENIYYI